MVRALLVRPFAIPGLGPQLARWSLVVLFAWLGAMRFTSGDADTMHQLLAENRLLGGVSGSIQAAVVAAAIGMLQLTAAALLALGPRWSRGAWIGAAMAAGMAAVPLTLLLTNPVWIDELGGFPAIGAGQGVIKYVAVVGVALFLFAHYSGADGLRRRACTVMLTGLLLPLLWIGGMKFTAIEAAGIEPLLSSSPFFAWMLHVFARQGASNVIGATELVTSGFLACWWFRPTWFLWGATLAILTFLGTLSFLVSLPGWHGSLGFPARSGAGQFIIKDVVLLAAAAILLTEHLRTEPSTR